MNLKENEIIVKESVLNKIIAILIFFAFIFVMIFKSDINFLKEKLFLQNGIITFISVFLFFLFLISIVKILDDKPLLKINDYGFWYRNSFIPFFPLKFWQWNEIDFVELNVARYAKYRTGKGLIIHKKNSLATKTIYLEDLNYPKEAIINKFKKHSNFLDYYNRNNIK